MKDRILLLLLLLSVVAFAAVTQITFGAPTAWTVVAPPPLNIDGVLTVERVIELPNDGGKWYVTVMGDKHNHYYTDVVGWFSSHDGLKSLKSKTHFHAINSDTAMYKDRYAAEVKALPTIRVQDSEGRVAFERWDNNIPISAEALYSAIAKGVKTAQRRPCNPLRPCPTPKPQEPEKTPCVPPFLDPEPSPLGPTEPLIFPDEPEPKPARGGPLGGATTALALLLSAVLGAGTGGFRQYRIAKEE